MKTNNIMKKNTLNIISLLLILLLVASCRKDEVVVTSISFKNVAVSVAKDGRSAEFTGRYEYTGTLSNVYLILSNEASMTKNVNRYEVQINEEKTLDIEVDGLENGTWYYYCFEGFNGYNSMRGSVYDFLALNDTTEVPVVRTLDVFEIGKHYAKANGEIIDDGGREIIDYGFCWGREQNPTINGKHIVIDEGQPFTVNMDSLVANAEYHVRAYATNVNGVGYGQDISFLTLAESVGEGTLNGVFVIGGNEVRFSKGLLQYNPSIDMWRFAEEQYDFIGKNNTNISENYNGWIDLFGWGTSGWNNRNTYYRPCDYQTGVENQGYGYGPTNGTNYSMDFTGHYANSDWGVFNGISNGGNSARQWRTLTFDELYFLLVERENAFEKASMATVNGVKGFILLPDVWALPEGCTFVHHANAANNVYDGDNWVEMEEAGAVFFPCSGQRIERNYLGEGYVGCYWLNATEVAQKAGRLYFQYNDLYDVVLDDCQRSYGLSVRLVQDAD